MPIAMETEVRARFERIEAILEVVTRQNREAMARMDRADTRMDRADARTDRADARMKEFDARVREMDARFQKRMRGFEKLAMMGLKELSQLRRAQQRTETSLNAFIDSLRSGGNGRGNGRAR